MQAFFLIFNSSYSIGQALPFLTDLAEGKICLEINCFFEIIK